MNTMIIDFSRLQIRMLSLILPTKFHVFLFEYNSETVAHVCFNKYLQGY